MEIKLMYTSNTELYRYAECANVSKTAFRKWSKAVTLTPMNTPLLLLTNGIKNNADVGNNPKTPPNAKYSKTCCGVSEHLTLRAKLSMEIT